MRRVLRRRRGLAQVEEIVIEVQDVPPGDARLIYQGQPVKQQIAARLGALGFSPGPCQWNKRAILEQDCSFLRLERRNASRGLQYAAAMAWL